MCALQPGDYDISRPSQKEAVPWATSSHFQLPPETGGHTRPEDELHVVRLVLTTTNAVLDSPRDAARDRQVHFANVSLLA